MAEYPDFDVLGSPLSLFGDQDFNFDEIDVGIFDDPFLEELESQIKRSDPEINEDESEPQIPEHGDQMKEQADLANDLQEDPQVLNDVDETIEPQAKRFKVLTDEELQEIADQRFSASTKRNSKWGFNVFDAWCKEKDLELDLATIPEDDLCRHLSVFYAEVQPKTGGEYHTNTMKNIRAAINRQIQVLHGRNINIVTGDNFKAANNMLNGKLKNNCRQGLSKPTAHKPVISQTEMEKIFLYFEKEGPIELRYKVWLQLSLQFVSRGLEFHGQLSPNSFTFSTDEAGVEFVTINHTTQQKNHQGDANSKPENSDKRMYATGGPNCPVETLKRYLSRVTTDAECLFTHINKEAIASPDKTAIWYGTKQVGKRQFGNFMPDICKNAGLEKRYTAHCLRATALNAMTDKDIPNLHIMSLSDHCVETSLVPYVKPSAEHKRKMSKCLTNVYTKTTENPPSRPSATVTSASEYMASQPLQPSSAINGPETVSLRPTSATNRSANLSLSQMMNGFITNSSCSFSNCNFQFGN